LAVEKSAIKSAIYQHSEFVAFIDLMNTIFSQWESSSFYIHSPALCGVGG